jgi:putative transposase
VEIAGIGRDPGGRWMEQMARNLVDAEDGLLRGKRYVIIDRDPLYTAAFRGILKAAGVKAVRLPAMSPNLNAYAERFVLSIKSECLGRIVPLASTIPLLNNVARDQTLSRNAPDRRFVQLRVR